MSVHLGAMVRFVAGRGGAAGRAALLVLVLVGRRARCLCVWVVVRAKKGAGSGFDSAWSNCKMSEMRSGNARICPHARPHWTTPAYAAYIGSAHACAQWLHPNA